MADKGTNQAYKPISNLSRAQLRTVRTRINAYLEANAEKLDAYSSAHLTEIESTVSKTLDADIVVTK